MAQYPGITLTNAGINMIAESQASGTALIFTNLKMGDGKLSDGEDIKALTAVKNPLLTALVSSYTNQGDGQIKARYVVSNSGLSTGFFAREIGIYAKLGTNGAEQLYAYTNAGNLSDYIPDKSTPVDEQIIDIYIVVSNASGITVVTDSSIVYTTKKDLDEHKAAADSHAPAFAAHNSDAGAHHDLLKAYLPLSGGYISGGITYSNGKNQFTLKNEYDNEGLILNPGSMGLFDLDNSRYAISYEQKTNTTTVGNSSGITTLAGTVYQGTVHQKGWTYYDGGSSEYRLQSSYNNTGFSLNSTGLALYDWSDNNRYIFNYNQSSNTVQVGNGTSSNTLAGITTAALSSSSTLGGYTAMQLLAAVQKTSASLGANGWWKDNNTGMIVQWTTVNSIASSGFDVVFPIAFPFSCFGVLALQKDSAYYYSCGTFNVNNTGFNIKHGNAQTINAFCIAVGH